MHRNVGFMNEISMFSDIYDKNKSWQDYVLIVFKVTPMLVLLFPRKCLNPNW